MKNTTLISIQQRLLNADQITTYLQNVAVDYQEDQRKRLLAESEKRLQRTGPQVTSNFVQLIGEAKHFKVLQDQMDWPESDTKTTQSDESETSNVPAPSSGPN
jgi:hypothetical protein